MNETSTSRIVVGVALAAVFGTGVYVFGVRTAHQQQLASAAAVAPVAAPPAAAPPEAIAPAPDQTAAPAVAAATPAPAANPEAATSPVPAPSDQAPPASDSRISADVKSQIASAAPNAEVNVTTTNGVVALAGSVPNQDAVNQAKQAALRVEGVKTVDASGLLVNNQ